MTQVRLMDRGQAARRHGRRHTASMGAGAAGSERAGEMRQLLGASNWGGRCSVEAPHQLVRGKSGEVADG
jgi:hypothetical protein